MGEGRKEGKGGLYMNLLLLCGFEAAIHRSIEAD